MAKGFFQDTNGNRSSSRLVGVVVIFYALLLSTGVLLFGYFEKSSVMVTATASGTIFTTIAGPAMYFLFSQRKNENSKSLKNDSKQG